MKITLLTLGYGPYIYPFNLSCVYGAYPQDYLHGRNIDNLYKIPYTTIANQYSRYGFKYLCY